MITVGNADRAAATLTPQPSYVISLADSPVAVGRYQDVYAGGPAIAPAPSSGSLVSSLGVAMNRIQDFVAKNAKGTWTVLTGTVSWIENGVVKTARWVATKTKAAAVFVVKEAKAAASYVAQRIKAAWDTLAGWVQKAFDFIRNFTAMLFDDRKQQQQAKQDEKIAQRRMAEQRLAAQRQAEARAQQVKRSQDVQAIVAAASTQGSVKLGAVPMSEAVRIMNTSVPVAHGQRLVAGHLTA